MGLFPLVLSTLQIILVLTELSASGTVLNSKCRQDIFGCRTDPLYDFTVLFTLKLLGETVIQTLAWQIL